MSLTFIATITELRKHFLLTAPRLTLLLAEPVDAHGEATEPVLRQIKEAHPCSPIVIYFDAAGHGSREIIELASLGVHELIFKGASDAPTLVRAALESAARSCGAEVVLNRMTITEPAGSLSNAPRERTKESDLDGGLPPPVDPRLRSVRRRFVLLPE